MVIVLINREVVDSNLRVSGVPPCTKDCNRKEESGGAAYEKESHRDMHVRTRN